MNWKKILLVVANVVVGAYLVLAVTAFNEPEDRALVCNDVVVSIEGEAIEGFLTTADVKHMLQADHLDPVGLQLSQIDTRHIEETLQRKDLIEKVQVYTTQNGNVHISIVQRVPVVRVMALNGDNYYVDNKGKPFKRTDYASNLIVATGSITPAYAAKWLAPVANEIRQDHFWRYQVVQLNVLPDGTMELVPRVGDHIVYLGLPTDVGRKLGRLRKFYLYGLNKVGWNKYSRISVDIDNQIICKRR